jgi:2-C-methyl-D-erythritol 2,4-cyclodiphosphate synthase
MQAHAPYRIGQGFDVHAFTEERPLIIGGVRLDHPLGLAGHSDADVLTHAIMDALLGAARLGDIGHLFPDTDPATENADSIELLARVAERLAHAGLGIVNIDATIIAQAPRMAPHLPLMIAHLASALGLAPECINLKATTTEQLGFTGRGEGIAAQAVALLSTI